jgi:G patch domain-containing protein 1
MGQTSEASTPAAAAATTAQRSEHAVVDVEKNDALSNERASEDVFKAIFGDDDDDED